MSILLSILIPTTPDRKPLFDPLFAHLESQLPISPDAEVAIWENTCYLMTSTYGDIEIIVGIDQKQMSIGEKRQLLIQEAKGEYVVFIDSDDSISDDYISEICKALESKPDCVGFQIECSGTPGKTASVSNQYKDWGEHKHGFYYIRTPYHKVPIKRDICLSIGFSDMRFGEDYDFAKRLKLRGLIKTQVYIPKVLYYYRFVYENPQTKYGFVQNRN